MQIEISIARWRQKSGYHGNLLHDTWYSLAQQPNKLKNVDKPVFSVPGIGGSHNNTIWTSNLSHDLIKSKILTVVDSTFIYPSLQQHCSQVARYKDKLLW